MAIPLLMFKAAVVGLAVYLISQTLTAFVPISIAFILAFILYPLVKFLTALSIGGKKIKISVPLAILLAFCAFGLVLFILVSVLFAPLIEEFNKLYKNIPQILTGIQLLLVEFENDILLPLAKSGIYDKQSEQLIAFLQKAITGGLSFSFSLLKNIANLSVNVVAKVVELIVVPVLTFYFIKDWRIILNAFTSLFDVRHRPKVEVILFEMGRVVSDFLRGQFLLCLIIGILMFIGLSLLKIEYPLVLALLAGIAEAVPIVGPILSAVPAIFIGMVTSPYLGLKVALFCFFVQQLENHILVPKVMSGSIHLHPASVIISILVAGQFLGFLGMIIALPTIALLKVLMKHFWITEEKSNGKADNHG